MCEAAGKRKISIPAYTLGEELFNAISHGLGALLSVWALVAMLLKAETPAARVTAALFGASMVILYTISCVYHSLSRKTAGKRVLRVLDHCTVFLLVLCTYLPVSLLGVGGALGWALVGGVFAFAAAGIVFNAVSLEKFKVASVLCELGCGWSILLGLPQLLLSMGRAGVGMLALGGALYTVGAVLYGIGARKRYMHSVFHLFCLAGTWCHFWAVYAYLL